MLRLPNFTYHRPTQIDEAVRIKAEGGPDAMFVAGGTDLYPNMKRRHQTPKDVVALAGIPSLREVSDDGAEIGAMARLTDLEHDETVCARYPALAHAISTISTPLLRNMGTIGGNLLLDTRCTYYNQTFEWRESIDFCMKEAGKICWVAPGSPRCWAVQSADTVPLLCAMGAEVTLVGGEDGERRVALDDLYRDDGIEYTTKQPNELLTKLHLPSPNGWRASYRKLRRRDTFDFPVLGVGAWVQLDGDIVTEARIRIGGAGSQALHATEAEAALVGKRLEDETIDHAARAAYRPTRPMDNTDHEVPWRKKMATVFVARALRDLVS